MIFKGEIADKPFDIMSSIHTKAVSAHTHTRTPSLSETTSGCAVVALLEIFLFRDGEEPDWSCQPLEFYCSKQGKKSLNLTFPYLPQFSVAEKHAWFTNRVFRLQKPFQSPPLTRERPCVRWPMTEAIITPTQSRGRVSSSTMRRRRRRRLAKTKVD